MEQAWGVQEALAEFWAAGFPVELLSDFPAACAAVPACVLYLPAEQEQLRFSYFVFREPDFVRAGVHLFSPALHLCVRAGFFFLRVPSSAGWLRNGFVRLHIADERQ